MRKATGWCLAAGVIVAISGLVRADEQADAKAIVDKAIKAQGGAEKLAKAKAASSKSKGKFYGFGDAIDYTLESSTQPPDKLRNEIQGEAMGNKFSFIQVIQGDKGWNSANGTTEELSEEQLKEGKENLYANWVALLHPITGKDFKLAPLAEVKVGDKEAVGVKVSSKGHRDISLFFDKKTGMLLKRETTVKDLMAGGSEVAEEVLYLEFKEKDGIQYASKVTINRDGKKYIESEITDYKPAEKLDDKVFDKPKD
jgi:outer membrane lipoprotein-sorting protein